MRYAQVDVPEPASGAVPPGGGIAIIGAMLMVVGAVGPWIGGQLLATSSGLALGGDGWLVVVAAGLAIAPVVLPLPNTGAKGLWAALCAAVGGFVCWTHYSQASTDGTRVVWGLQLAALGCAVLALGAVRLLRSSV